MKSDTLPRRFAVLVSRFLDESISSEEMAELEFMLLESDTLRESFYEQTFLHEAMSSSAPEDTSHSVITGAFPESLPPTPKAKPWGWILAGGIAASLSIGLFLGRESVDLQPVTIASSNLGPVKEEPFDAEKRYRETMEKIGEVGSQTRPPEKSAPALTSHDTLSFNRDIRPILSDRCFACHGPDASTREADLRLDLPEAAHAALSPDDDWHQIKPGEPEKSEVFYRITTDDETDKMPPAESKLPRMTPTEISKIERWIREGAPYEQHWSFTPIERPEIPEAQWPNLARNPIDHFIQRKLAETEFAPAPEADHNTLLRRIHFDLTGLPPAPNRVKSVAKEGMNGDTYNREITALLGSIHHAEHFAVSWLDKARYADTTGYQYDTPRIMWRWRDWVVNAYAENQRYDQFLTEQIAGDLLPGATRDQIIATGYNRNHPITIEGGTIAEEYRVQYVSDRVNTLGSSVLGLTMECAKCHDHKYDPISQRDYFRMFAFFNNIPEGGSAGGGRIGSPLGAIAKPYIMAPSAEQEKQQASLQSSISKVVAQCLSAKGKDRDAFEKWRTTMLKTADWKRLAAAKVESSGGLPFRNLGDDSWLVESQANTGKGETYTFEIPMEGDGWQSLLVEALRHETLPKGGPGRFGNANAVLSRVELIEIHPENGSENSVPLHAVEASYEQNGYPASNLIKDPGGKGWGFFHPKMEDRQLIVTTKRPFGFKQPWTLRVRLEFSRQWANHTFGRTRLSLSRINEIEHSDESFTPLLQKDFEELKLAERNKLVTAFLQDHAPESAKRFQSDLRALEAIKAEIPPVMVMEEMEVPRPTYILARGAYDAPTGDPLEPSTPEALNPFPENTPQNRLGLAKWLTSRENPLTARVAVNHLWDRFFEFGLVKTVEDFGSQGEWPSHPDLLDWLAVELIESGWDRQHIVRLILNSHTYRQSSHERPAVRETDPENRLLARGPRGRFPAEVIRDQALAVSGLLNREVGGPGVNPYQPPGIWEELTLRPGFAMSYTLSEGADIYRRSLYTFYKRAAPPAMMSVFDAPSREICTVRRETTNTPLQALALFNGETYVEAARALAQKLLHEMPDAEDETLLREAFLRIVHREPSAEEESIARRIFEAERARISDPESTALLEVGRLPLVNEIEQDRLLGLTAVNRMFLNLSETVTQH